VSDIVGTTDPPRRPTYSWRVWSKVAVDAQRRSDVVVRDEVTGDSLHITSCGALVIAGPMPKTTVLRAWAPGEWLSVEKVET
jgi:hypothetical protein